MNQSNNIIYLRHSSILALPIIGSLVYTMQLMMLKNALTKTIYISRRENSAKGQLMRMFSEKKLVFCQTYKLGNLLEKIKSNIVFDVDTLDIESMSRPQLYELMWTLVFCQSVTIASRKSLNLILPLDFPVYESKK